MSNINKKFVYAQRFDGQPKSEDFNLVIEPFPLLKDGEIHCVAEAISIDPGLRAFGSQFKLNEVVPGYQLATIIESQHPNYKVKQRVVGYLGWQQHWIGDPEKIPGVFGFEKCVIVPEIKDIPPTLFLGVLGIAGLAAYFGIKDVIKPSKGEVIAVSAAGGAVGSIAGQIAKIIGCKVIGFAGTDEKVKWLKTTLKFDDAYNYKTTDIVKIIKSQHVNGIDCYFDNVGGRISSDIISCLTEGGRIAVCGSISTYNHEREKTPPPQCDPVQHSFIMKCLKMEGFNYKHFDSKREQAIAQLTKWVQEGKLKYRETITSGFDKIPEAFIGMLKGLNTGKAIVSLT